MVRCTKDWLGALRICLLPPQGLGGAKTFTSTQGRLQKCAKTSKKRAEMGKKRATVPRYAKTSKNEQKRAKTSKNEQSMFCTWAKLHARTAYPSRPLAYCLLPTTHHPPPTTYQLLTTIQLPTTNYQLPTTNYQLPTKRMVRSYPPFLKENFFDRGGLPTCVATE